MEIESFFFISLAVTFVLLVALVYHFRQKFITIDQRVNNVIEIMNTVVKEMQNLKVVQDKCINNMPNMCCMPVNSNEYINISADSFIETKNLGRIQENFNGENVFSEESDDEDDDDEDEDDEDDDSDSEDEYESEKIVVSDDEDNIEILDITDNDITTESVSQPVLEELLESDILLPEITIISNTDYRKMDIHQLRNIALEKGIDGKKMKKNELLKILENV